MRDDLQDKLRHCISMALALLPRWSRHDFWRITEPQHRRVHDAISEAILARIDNEFEIAVKLREPETPYNGTGHHRAVGDP